jgi:hypothetical protein
MNVGAALSSRDNEEGRRLALPKNPEDNRGEKTMQKEWGALLDERNEDKDERTWRNKSDWKETIVIDRARVSR